LPTSEVFESSVVYAKELDLTLELIREWIDSSDQVMRQYLRWQFLGRSKYYRPFTIFACHRAVSSKRIDEELIRIAAVIELFHNMSLIVDDILDRSRTRRNRQSLHCRFGFLPALMTAGFITASGFRLISDSPFAIRCLSELVERLGIAECVQWRLRRQPLGVEDWRSIAGEDTGSMFEICACLGARSESFRRFGNLLGILYHGCDDVCDLQHNEALDGGGEEDVRDGILTLPVAIAIRDPAVAVRFRTGSNKDKMLITSNLRAALPDASAYLDSIAAEARSEASKISLNTKPLIELVNYTRSLTSI